MALYPVGESADRVRRRLPAGVEKQLICQIVPAGGWMLKRATTRAYAEPIPMPGSARIYLGSYIASMRETMFGCRSSSRDSDQCRKNSRTKLIWVAASPEEFDGYKLVALNIPSAENIRCATRPYWVTK